ncbi:MAG: hypothetical protein A2060_02965 [Planctomycetes bacterium GWA2_50_13]|nr:MAG: hypothetical protein A2060_02965 [Planctomycetes bacterium GWA2_50_13]OHB94839.1 MAG: hypothetical protein A3I59_01840 [Planctomycetes bacterium RIFCSPLOWO2_02_FULL_50_16]
MSAEDEITAENRTFAMTLVWKCTRCGYLGETGCVGACKLPGKCPGCGTRVEDLVVVTED